VTRVAAIDCGTNTARLLVADLDAETGTAVDMHRVETIVRLGEGVDRTRRLADAALTRTYAALETYAGLIQAAGVGRTRCVATSAVRDASNHDEFLSGVQSIIGVRPDVLSGDEEARLSYDGATRGLPQQDAVWARAPLLVVDVGGGSTELVFGDDDGPPQGTSLDIGSVRLTERHLHSDPPTPAEVAAAVADVSAAVDGAGLRLAEAGAMVGVSGTVLTMAAFVLGLDRYDSTRVHHARLPAADLLHACDRMLAMPVGLRRRLGFMVAGRADVIGGGALVLAEVVRRTRLDTVVASEHDILDGVAWSLA
jgi:exopolyphosphatase / guanosine-5'-triphosphate,3'-diphosphate pyrophosphatase